MSDTVQIPDDVKITIDNAAIDRSNDQFSGWKPTYERVAYQAQTISDFKCGAEFGYSISQQQLEEKDKEISDLKEQLSTCKLLWADGMNYDQTEAYETELKRLFGLHGSQHTKDILDKFSRPNTYNKLQSFREKLSSLGPDDYLKDMGVAIKLFDEYFK